MNNRCKNDDKAMISFTEVKDAGIVNFISSNLNLEFIPQVQLVVKQLVAQLPASNRTTFFFFICDNSYHLKDFLERGKIMECNNKHFVLPFRYIRKKVCFSSI